IREVLRPRTRAILDVTLNNQEPSPSAIEGYSRHLATSYANGTQPPGSGELLAPGVRLARWLSDRRVACNIRRRAKRRLFPQYARSGYPGNSLPGPYPSIRMRTVAVALNTRVDRNNHAQAASADDRIKQRTPQGQRRDELAEVHEISDVVPQLI